MLRTDVYLTKTERDGLAQVARKKRVGVATIIRDIVDKALGIEIAPIEIDLPVLDLKREVRRAVKQDAQGE
jgi:hypothetical protein